MNRPEHELARGIARILDHGVENLEPGARERLLIARNAALSHYREKPLRLDWTGGALAIVSEHRIATYVVVAAMMFALAGVAYWHSTRPENGLTDIDMGLLTDELPLNAYVDKGFDSWLKRSPR